MFTTAFSERIFTEAWDTGCIHSNDWMQLLSEVADEDTYLIVSRLMYAIRRGRLTIVD